MVRVEDPRQRDVLAHDGRRHRLGDPVAHGEGEPQDARGVLDRLLGLDRAVGDDLRDAVGAVLLDDVLDDLTAAAFVEVDVEVGHGHALGVEEALEEQAVAQRVQVGDLHGVGGHRPGARATARADPDAVLLGPVDEVGDDEEVPGVPLGDDDLDLVLGLLAHVVGDAAPGSGGASPRPDLLDEPALLVLPLRAGEARHVGAGRLGEGDVAALGDEQGVVAGLGVVAPHVAHLGGALEVELVGVELEALGVGQRRAGLHAQQRRVRLGVLGVGVVQVVGRQQRQVEVLRELQQVVLDAALDVEAVVHELAEEVLRAEDVAVVRRRPCGPRRTGRAAAASGPPPRGSRWWR